MLRYCGMDDAPKGTGRCVKQVHLGVVSPRVLQPEESS